MTPLVLVENEVTASGLYDHWQDVTGERYQFPNQYHTKITTGRPFIYYRGTRRLGSSRGTPEYFGCGVVGSVYPDPTNAPSVRKSFRKWICEIEEYRPFPTPVPARIGDRYLENIPRNFWGVGVRNLPESVYNAIIHRARLVAAPVELPAAQLDLPPIDSVQIRPTPSLFLTRAIRSGVASEAQVRNTQRRSRYSVALGKRGEEIVLKHLRETLSSAEVNTLRWISNEGETPGWDIQYKSGRKIVAIEVKASGGPSFPSIELSAHEWNAALQLGERYTIALVASVKSREPRLELLTNPARLAEQGQVAVQPAVWRLFMRSQAEGVL